MKINTMRVCYFKSSLAERIASIDSRQQSPELTMSGSVLGTPAFMSPEQARGFVEAVDASSDIYSVGAIHYNLLTGQAPYCVPDQPNTARSVLDKVIDGAPPKVQQLNPDAPKSLIAICEKAMSREKVHRYESCLDLAKDLQSSLNRDICNDRTGYHSGGLRSTVLMFLRRNLFRSG